MFEVWFDFSDRMIVWIVLKFSREVMLKKAILLAVLNTGQYILTCTFILKVLLYCKP